jgi:hypothetical protein
VAARDEFEVEYEPVHGDAAVFLHDPFYAFPGPRGREPHEQHELPRPFLGATLEPLRLLRDVAGVPGP